MDLESSDFDNSMSCHEKLEDIILRAPDTIDSVSVDSDESDSRRTVHFRTEIVSDVWERPYINQRDKCLLFYNKAEIRRFKLEMKDGTCSQRPRLHSRNITPPAPFRPAKEPVTPETMVMIDTMYLF
mmetsp:Transcript_17047/g.25809  ORF Transcript_17047/g.25809 Transcript_17047/m.25809 type:complete len:127 (+) Transcript_17047:265-645(+)